MHRAPISVGYLKKTFLELRGPILYIPVQNAYTMEHARLGPLVFLHYVFASSIESASCTLHVAPIIVGGV